MGLRANSLTLYLGSILRGPRALLLRYHSLLLMLSCLLSCLFLFFFGLDVCSLFPYFCIQDLWIHSQRALSSTSPLTLFAPNAQLLAFLFVFVFLWFGCMLFISIFLYPEPMIYIYVSYFLIAFQSPFLLTLFCSFYNKNRENWDRERPRRRIVKWVLRRDILYRPRKIHLGEDNI